MLDLNTVFITQRQREEALRAFMECTTGALFVHTHGGVTTHENILLWDGPVSKTTPIFKYTCPWNGQHFGLSARRAYLFLTAGVQIPKDMRMYVPYGYPILTIDKVAWARSTVASIRYADGMTLNDEMMVTR